MYKVLITGVAGFIGSNLAKRILNEEKSGPLGAAKALVKFIK